MHRRTLLAELEAYRPADDRERAMLEQLRAFVLAEPACFERTTAAGHITGSAWVVDPTASFALLTHHRKLDRWLQFGGHADGDPNVRNVALREALEESGVAALRFASGSIYDVDVHEIPARGDEPAHLHYDVRYAFFADRSEQPSVSAESHDVAWVALADIELLRIDDSVRRLIAKTPSLAARAEGGRV
jgi:8-oxo-dGTP pyrophosphatase MutT (NUDIX family)